MYKYVCLLSIDVRYGSKHRRFYEKRDYHLCLLVVCLPFQAPLIWKVKKQCFIKLQRARNNLMHEIWLTYEAI